MAADPYRALVVVACVLAVAVGGVALPATEYGGVPGSDVDAADSPDSSAGGVSGVFWGETPADPTAQEPDGTPTPTATPTPTPTPTPDDDRGDSVPLLPTGWFGGGLLLVASLLVLGIVAILLPGLAGRVPFLPDRVPGFGVLDRIGGLPAVPNPLSAISARVTATTLSVPSATARLGHALQGALVGTGAALGGAAAALGSAGRMQASAFGALASALGSVRFGLPTSLSDLAPGFGRGDLQEARAAAGGSTGTGGDAGGDGAGEPSRLSVADVWIELRRLVSIPRPASRTPAEIARAAVDQGLPRGPVMRLTDTFREVTYGRADPAGVREAAVGALRSLRDAIGGEG